MYVSVLVEPFQLARVTGYRASVRCSLPTAGAASNLCLASRAAFPVAGAKADAGYGFLWPLGRARRRRVLAAPQSSAARRLFRCAKEHYAAMPPDLRRFHGARVQAASRREFCCSLTQEYVQRSLLRLKGAFDRSAVARNKTRRNLF